MTSASQFAWQYISHEIGVTDWPPPEPKRGDQYGHDDLCWLCGGATDGVGWPQKTAFAPTFTNFNLAVVPSSQSACQACVAMARFAEYRGIGKHTTYGMGRVRLLSDDERWEYQRQVACWHERLQEVA